IGVVIVEVIRYAVVTQACRDSPWRSSEIVRIAVETIVWSRAPRNIPLITPVMMVRICRWLYSPDADEGEVEDFAAEDIVPHSIGCSRQPLNRARESRLDLQPTPVGRDPVRLLVAPLRRQRVDQHQTVP